MQARIARVWQPLLRLPFPPARARGINPDSQILGSPAYVSLGRASCPVRQTPPLDDEPMARPMGPVRLKKASPVTLLIGVVLCIFIVYFLAAPSSASTAGDASTKPPVAAHPLSPPTSPFRKPPAQSKGRPSPPPVSRYNLNNVTITSNPIENRENVLILTPMARFYQEYWDNLLRLTYPHHLITVGFILPKNKEGNAATSALQAQITKTQKSGAEKDRFKSLIILRQDFESPLPNQDEAERHKMQNQRPRRAAMSKARNSLLFTTLGPSTSWVLWLDADIVETPPTLIQDLAAHNRPIIAPNCFQRYFNKDTQKPRRAAVRLQQLAGQPDGAGARPEDGPRRHPPRGLRRDGHVPRPDGLHVH